MGLFDEIDIDEEMYKLENVEINKCPFCGNDNFDEDSEDGIVIECLNTTRRGFVNIVGCKKCGCWGPQKETAINAVDAWNKPTAKFKERIYKKKSLIGKII